jgi:hypothetical protein
MKPSACSGCKFWSEMIAQSVGGGPVEAWCLNDLSPHRNRYVYRGCEHRVEGVPVDMPAKHSFDGLGDIFTLDEYNQASRE